MSLSLKFSNSIEKLAQKLASEEPTRNGPFQSEYIIVASTGVRRWLSLKLADERGICGNCEFPTPRTFIDKLLGAVIGDEEDSVFSRQAMVWRLYGILKSGEADSDLAIPLAYVEDKPDLAAMQLAQRVADLFDQYLTYRPDWILKWDSGKHLSNLSVQAKKHEQWQRRLWDKLSGGHAPHRASLYKELIQRLEKERVPILPEAISIFAAHTLPPVFLEILKALGQNHEVNLYLTQPTPEFWGDHPLSALQKSNHDKRLKTENFPGGIDQKWTNPLIAAWGSQGRDLFNLLIDKDIYTDEPDDLALFSEPVPDSILEAVQQSVYALQPSINRGVLNPLKDDSLRIHCCHHPLREVEVLHDSLLRFFKNDPDLQPNDILVLSPDLDAYAPFIEAVFNSREKGVPALPFGIADRSVRAANRVVDVFYRILEVCRGRFGVTELYGLFQSPAFRQRFGWDDNDLSKIRTWLSETHTAWGMNAHHRHTFELPEIGDYSWESTLDKLFLGYAIKTETEQPEERQSHYDAVEGRDSLLIGKLAEAYHLLKQAAIQVKMPRPAEEWADCLEKQVVIPFLESNDNESHEVRQIRAGLEVLRKASSGIQEAVDPQTVTAFLETIIEDGLPARGFLSRGITFGSLTPMRAIPHKVVCLLGMNSGAFPRDPRRLAFDLMAQDGLRRTGDRAGIPTDRYLFLETLLSAKKKLHISYTGFSPQDDAISPPSVPVDELLSFLETAWPRPEKAKGKEAPKIGSRFVVEHRLHGHHPAYFMKRETKPLFSYSKSKYEAAKAQFAIRPTTEEVSMPASSKKSELTITADELTEFFIHPSKHFGKEVLGIAPPFAEADLSDEEPLEFNNLDKYTIQNVTANATLFNKTQPMRVALPPGQYGDWLKKDIVTESRISAQTLKDALKLPDTVEETVVEIDLVLNCDSINVTLIGKLGSVINRRQIRFRSSSKVGVKDILRGWIRHLVLSASEAIEETIVTGKDAKKAHIFPKLDTASAKTHLIDLIKIYIAGQNAPLPFVLECSDAYWHSKDDPDKALSSAQMAWDPYRSWNPPNKDPWILLCWGDQVPFEPPFTAAFATSADNILRPLYESKESPS